MRGLGTGDLVSFVRLTADARHGPAAPCSSSSRRARAAGRASRRGRCASRVAAGRVGHPLRRLARPVRRRARPDRRSATYDAARQRLVDFWLAAARRAADRSTSPSSVVNDAQRSLLDPGPGADLAVQRRQPVRGVLVRRGARRRRGDGRVRPPRRDARQILSSSLARLDAALELAGRREADREPRSTSASPATATTSNRRRRRSTASSTASGARSTARHGNGLLRPRALLVRHRRARLRAARPGGGLAGAERDRRRLARDRAHRARPQGPRARRRASVAACTARSAAPRTG